MNAPDEYWLPSLNAVRVPDGIDDGAVIDHLLEEYDLEIASGLGDLEGDIWRIGCMGYSARPKTSSTSSRRWRTRWASRVLRGRERPKRDRWPTAERFLCASPLGRGMNDLRTGLSYGDVLLVPQRSPVDSRSDVDLSTRAHAERRTSVAARRPAAMDTVTEAELAIELARAGGMGVLHRFLTVDEQATQVEQVAATGSPVAAAVGINEDYIARSAAPAAAGVDALVVDVAHGHLERTITAVETIADEFPDVDIVAGITSRRPRASKILRPPAPTA